MPSSWRRTCEEEKEQERWFARVWLVLDYLLYMDDFSRSSVRSMYCRVGRLLIQCGGQQIRHATDVCSRFVSFYCIPTYMYTNYPSAPAASHEHHNPTHKPLLRLGPAQRSLRLLTLAVDPLVLLLAAHVLRGRPLEAPATLYAPRGAYRHPVPIVACVCAMNHAETVCSLTVVRVTLSSKSLQTDCQRARWRVKGYALRTEYRTAPYTHTYVSTGISYPSLSYSLLLLWGPKTLKCRAAQQLGFLSRSQKSVQL